MIPVEETYIFELTDEVREKIAQAKDKPALIDEAELADLQYVEIRNGYPILKRMLDVAIAFFALLVLALPMFLIAIAIKIDDPGTVLFSQKRVGRDGRRFRFYKFRTMREDTPKYRSTSELDNPEQYITRLGKFLRRSSLDELPQLLNVLKGDMSLVGPRPLISDEFEIHRMRMRYGVYNVRPGVTGLAQINGRDMISPAEKVRWDVKYLENFGFAQDAKILFGTIPKVFGASGVAEGYNTKKEEDKEEAANDA